MAVGDRNPVLENNRVYYDIKTGETRVGGIIRRRWLEAEKACVEPAPLDGGPYARCGDAWVDIGPYVTIAEQ